MFYSYGGFNTPILCVGVVDCIRESLKAVVFRDSYLIENSYKGDDYVEKLR